MDINTIREKRLAVATAESAGVVADSMEVRMDLMRRVESGEITLAMAQAELKKIKAGAKRAGKLTRAQVYRRW
jgi:hypothetical protein